MEQLTEMHNIDAYAMHDVIYDQIATAVKKLSKTRLLFKTTAVIEKGEFEQNFPAEMKEVYKCNACGEFFGKFGGVVYLDEKGNPKSALFGEAKSDNADIQRSLDELKAKVESAPIVDFLHQSELNVKKTGGFRVGLKKAGGWPHFYMDISKKYNCAYGDFALIVNGTITLLDKYKESDLAHYLSELKAHVCAHKDIPAPQKEKIGNVKDAIERILGIKCSHGVSYKKAVMLALDDAFGNKEKMSVLTSLIRFNGSTLGGAIRSLDGGQSIESVMEGVVSRLDIDNFRVQDTENLSQEGLKQAEKKFQESAYMSSLDRRRAKVEDLEHAWVKPNVDESEDDVEFNPFSKVKTKGQVVHKPVKVTAPQRVTLQRFINEILPKADSVRMDHKASGVPWTFNVPKDVMSPSIFVWDDNSGRAYCSSVPRFSVHWFEVNVPSKGETGDRYVDIEAVVPTPWTFGIDDSRMQGADPTWVLVATAKNEPRKIDAVSSYGQALKGELYPYRRAVDAALKHAKVECDGTYAVGFAFGVGMVLDGVRVLADGIEQTYTIDGTVQ
ncbi:hypothetical protein [Vibrio crassostreae]|uniref:hypothetical protein n=1 Tax=Vibrio crassostreae TaxID=246167 RepID=UPI001B304296|nr:hypothetical protein [Vibrio crassostreae]